jgi:hypothetical protein
MLLPATTVILSSMPYSAALAVEERQYGETVWVALRARGSEWSLLTPDEAIQVAKSWLEKYLK